MMHHHRILRTSASGSSDADTDRRVVPLKRAQNTCKGWARRWPQQNPSARLTSLIPQSLVCPLVAGNRFIVGGSTVRWSCCQLSVESNSIEEAAGLVPAQWKGATFLQSFGWWPREVLCVCYDKDCSWRVSDSLAEKERQFGKSSSLS
jgi:hypothetical protein